MQNIIDFLTFKTLITKDIFIIVYYIMVIMIPLTAWIFKRYMLEKMLKLFKIEKTDIKLKYRIYFYILLFMSILCAELCLRMMFEFVIAYFNMEEYLRMIAKK